MGQTRDGPCPVLRSQLRTAGTDHELDYPKVILKTDAEVCSTWGFRRKEIDLLPIQKPIQSPISAQEGQYPLLTHMHTALFQLPISG